MLETKNVTDNTFNEEVLNVKDQTIMVDFWATWCGPCRAVSPILDQIASEHQDKIKLVKLDVDANPEMSRKYGITSIPAMKLFRNGQVIKTIIGARPKAQLEADLADILA